MTTRSYRASSVRRCLGGILLGLATLFAGNGCVGPTYRATELPPEYAAKPVDKLNTADLSKLVSHSVRSSQIGIGDLLEVTASAGYSNGETEPPKVYVNVAADGTADIPPIGPVRVDGLNPEEAQLAIADAARQRDVFRTPYISVRVEEQRVNKIAVSGQVVEPGVVEVPRGNSTLLSAILAAGGLTEDASAEVTISRPALAANTPDALRGNPLRLTGGGDSVVLASYEEERPEQARTFEINLVSASKKGKGVYFLDDGDVVHVKKRPERKIRVGGLVKLPGEFDMPVDEDMYLADALTQAGDHDTMGADSVVVLRRMSGVEKPITIKASMRDAKRNKGNIRLQANDVVIVEETPVTLAIEALKSFFRFSIGSSMVLF